MNIIILVTFSIIVIKCAKFYHELLSQENMFLVLYDYNFLTFRVDIIEVHRERLISLKLLFYSTLYSYKDKRDFH